MHAPNITCCLLVAIRGRWNTYKRVGSKIIKKYDSPKTPYQRLLESEAFPNHLKMKLTQIYKTMNPFFLKKEMDKKLKVFYDLVEVNKRYRNAA